MLQFEGKYWQEYAPPEMQVVLWHSPVAAPRIRWSIELPFVPAGVDLENDCEKPIRHFSVDVDGYLPGPTDWHDLEGRVFAPVPEDIFAGPEIRVSSYGPGDVLWIGPDTTACLVRFRKRDGWRFQVELSAWFTREASKLWQMRQRCQQLVPAGGGEEAEEDLPEEWTQSRDLYWIGDVVFGQVNCAVPINSPRPHDVARRMAKAALNLTEFRSVRINGERKGIPPTPELAVADYGRLVILTTTCF